MQYLLAGLLTTAAMNSCSFDEQVSGVKGKNSETILSLNIHSSSIGKTRTATDLTAGGTSTALTDPEKEIQNLVIGVFDDAGDALRGAVKNIDTSGEAQPVTTNTYNENFAAGAATYDAGDSIFVAINMPSSVQNSLYGTTGTDGKNTRPAFVSQEVTIDEALTAGTGTVSPDQLPKFGKSVLAGGTDGVYTANVDVAHLVAKVTLASLTVDFDDDAAHDGYTSFTPTQIFLINVPEKLDLQVNADNTYQYAPSIATYYQGEVSNATNQKDYLGTTELTATALTTTNTDFGTTYTFYTMPNKAGRDNTDAAEYANRTRLVIKGTYSENAGQAAAQSHTAYYAINLGTTTDHSVEANYHYIVTAVIKGDGATTVDGAIPDIENLTTTVSVADWTDKYTNVTINNSGYNYGSGIRYDGITVGSIIYADGHWSPTYTDECAEAYGDPIAIVFSTTTSSTDQAAGWVNGYAMSLKNLDCYTYNGGTDAIHPANLKKNWCAPAYVNTQVTSSLVTSLANLKADMDGLTHCKDVVNYCETNSANIADFYAVDAAMNVMKQQQMAPSVSSGWYLPSIGQIYTWLRSFDGSRYTGSENWTASTNQWSIQNYASLTANELNTYMSTTANIPSQYFDTFKQTSGSQGDAECFYSSTEYSAGMIQNMLFWTNNSMFIDGTITKSQSGNYYYAVRPVFAF